MFITTTHQNNEVRKKASENDVKSLLTQNKSYFIVLILQKNKTFMGNERKHKKHAIILSQPLMQPFNTINVTLTSNNKRTSFRIHHNAEKIQ
jgi:hypothetical protein